VRLRDGTVHAEEVHWYEAHGIGRREFKIKFPLLDWQMRRLARSQVRFAVCIKNKGYEASLEIGKLYRMIPDQEAERHGYLRIVDESGEDYLFEKRQFAFVDLPAGVRRRLLALHSTR
jgi:hypothetical protein